MLRGGFAYDELGQRFSAPIEAASIDVPKLGANTESREKSVDWRKTIQIVGSKKKEMLIQLLGTDREASQDENAFFCFLGLPIKTIGSARFPEHSISSNMP